MMKKPGIIKERESNVFMCFQELNCRVAIYENNTYGAIMK